MKKTTVFSTNYMAILNSEFSGLEWTGNKQDNNNTYKTFIAYKNDRKVTGKIGLCFENAEASVVLEYDDYVEPPTIESLIEIAMNQCSIKYKDIDDDSNMLSQLITMTLSQNYYVSTKSIFKVKTERIKKNKLRLDINQKFAESDMDHNLVYDFKSKKCTSVYY